MHNDSPVNGLDAQVPDAAAGSSGDRTFQAAVLFRQSETQLWMSEYAAEPSRQPLSRQRFKLVVAHRKPCYGFQETRIAARGKDHYGNAGKCRNLAHHRKNSLSAAPGQLRLDHEHVRHMLAQPRNALQARLLP